jgi:hypothetical protein
MITQGLVVIVVAGFVVEMRSAILRVSFTEEVALTVLTYRDGLRPAALGGNHELVHASRLYVPAPINVRSNGTWLL